MSCHNQPEHAQPYRIMTRPRSPYPGKLIKYPCLAVPRPAKPYLDQPRTNLAEPCRTIASHGLPCREMNKVSSPHLGSPWLAGHYLNKPHPTRPKLTPPQEKSTKYPCLTFTCLAEPSHAPPEQTEPNSAATHSYLIMPYLPNVGLKSPMPIKRPALSIVSRKAL